MAVLAPPDPPAAAAPSFPPGRVDYQCADGRRMLVLYQRAQAIVRIERHPPVVLSPAARPDVWRSDAYDGGPFILTRTAAGAALASPGWPDTTCRP